MSSGCVADVRSDNDAGVLPDDDFAQSGLRFVEQHRTTLPKRAYETANARQSVVGLSPQCFAAGLAVARSETIPR